MEEADETEYWLELINDTNLSKDVKELERLTTEARGITKIMSQAKDSTYKNRK